MANTARLREATFRDHAAITQVFARNDGGLLDSASTWEHDWKANPFYREGFPIGWVLEDGAGNVVGTFSNIPMEYEFRGRSIRAAFARAWSVDPTYRNYSILLAREFISQKNVDLMLATRANPIASKVYQSILRMTPISADDRGSFLWILSYPGVVRAYLRIRKVPLAGLWSPMAAAGLMVCDRLLRVNRRVYAKYDVHIATQFDERFDRFWCRLREQSGHLSAVRSRAALAWRFDSSRLRGRTTILTIPEGDDIGGYLILVRASSERGASGMVADLQVPDDRAEYVRTLLSAALKVSREQGIAYLVSDGFNSFKHDILLEASPHRQIPRYCSCFYKAFAPELQRALEDAAAWDLGPCDGDGIL